nr:unnamed protein product [uncultured bacterium]
MSKISFKTASSKKNSFDRSSLHVTTLDFGKPNVSNILSVNQFDSVHINLNQFMRLSPLAVPTYGNVKLITRAFYVPNRLLTPNWQGFYSNDTQSPYKSLPNFNMFTLWSYMTSSTSGILQVASSSETPDYTVSASTPIKYVLTDKGRFFVQIMHGLGYVIYPATSDSSSSAQSFSQSFLPLLAYLRIYGDCLYPSRYLDPSFFGDLFVLDHYDMISDAPIIFDAFVRTLFCPYEGDFFCDTWAGFNSPDGVRNPLSNGVEGTWMNDLSNTNNSQDTPNAKIVSTPGGTYATLGSAKFNPDSAYTLSSYGHRLLDALSDFCLRNNLAGTRFLDYIKARFGFTNKIQNSNYAQFLGSYISNSNIMDVTSTAETLSSSSGDVLGAQAGKGYINGDGQLSFDVPEVGFIIFISWLSPSYGYYQGVKPWCLDKKSRFDYYTPEFDSVGNEAIPSMCLFGDTNIITDFQVASGNPTAFEAVFGFAPRYAFEYKTGHDFLTGDFRYKSRNKGLDSFHTFRTLKPQKNNKVLIPNNFEFRVIDNQYDRIFSSSFASKDKNYDHFIGYFQFSTKVYSNQKSISQSLPFYEEDGSEVTVVKN